MKVLITGGTGFIGTRLALKCLEKGDKVRLLGQVNNAAEEGNRDLVERQGGEIVIGSVTDKDVIDKAIEGVEIVYHLAAAQHEANVPDQHFWEVNVAGTRNLLEASRKDNVKRFVHGSTIGVYGAAMEGEIDEDTPLQPDNIYGITKREGEKLVLSYKDRLPVVIIRISETYGPGDRRLLKLLKAIDKKMFFMIGKGDNRHQLIFVDDLIEGLWLAAKNDEALGQVFVLAGKEILTTNQMVATIAKVLGVTQRKLRAPLWPFLITAVVMENLLRPLHIQPPLHRRRMDFFKKSFCFSQDKSSSILKFEPKTSFEDGIVATAQWYKEHNYL
ncbi:NAD-dependent epimerase/dehydratase [Nitrosococcus halophilus Nc 4]|uniref:NAD-dependent epimerase/dehydratase n=1 Tax=Nitrosococcus halophilus (strain Nc4) TaxID=472759 RepID=D5C0N0_NITHN|nr:NAD(P)-dependent oxidoreductase [Nitrosococcus halophilus]ADE16353.1 NAD-dependent epimerase/dehydratase [Nitrosococcus halophilus Nc 4]